MYATTGEVTEVQGDLVDTHRWVFRQYNPLKTIHALLERLAQLTGTHSQWGRPMRCTEHHSLFGLLRLASLCLASFNSQCQPQCCLSIYDSQATISFSFHG